MGGVNHMKVVNARAGCAVEADVLDVHVRNPSFRGADWYQPPLGLSPGQACTRFGSAAFCRLPGPTRNMLCWMCRTCPGAVTRGSPSVRSKATCDISRQLNPFIFIMSFLTALTADPWESEPRTVARTSPAMKKRVQPAF